MYLLIGSYPSHQIHLYLYEVNNLKLLTNLQWLSRQDLAQNLLKNIIALLKEENLSLADLKGLGAFAGPAGFTDLRIVHTVANSLAYSLKIPIVNASSLRSWQINCLQKLKQAVDYKIIKPDYGPINFVTKPKK